jgi:hypothetical protein
VPPANVKILFWGTNHQTHQDNKRNTENRLDDWMKRKVSTVLPYRNSSPNTYSLVSFHACMIIQALQSEVHNKCGTHKP